MDREDMILEELHRYGRIAKSIDYQLHPDKYLDWLKTNYERMEKALPEEFERKDLCKLMMEVYRKKE